MGRILLFLLLIAAVIFATPMILDEGIQNGLKRDLIDPARKIRDSLPKIVPFPAGPQTAPEKTAPAPRKTPDEGPEGTDLREHQIPHPDLLFRA